MKIYRVEHEDTGIGPHQDFVSERFNDLCLIAELHDRQPLPRFHIMPSTVFGFFNLEAVYKWYNSNERKELHQHGFIIACYRVKSIANHDAMQLTFSKHGAKLMKSISLREDMP